MREGCLQRIFREDLSRKFRVEKIESRNWGRNSRRIARERSNGVTVTVSGPVSGPDCRPPYWNTIIKQMVDPRDERGELPQQKIQYKVPWSPNIPNKRLRRAETSNWKARQEVHQVRWVSPLHSWDTWPDPERRRRWISCRLSRIQLEQLPRLVRDQISWWSDWGSEDWILCWTDCCLDLQKVYVKYFWIRVPILTCRRWEEDNCDNESWRHRLQEGF